MPSRFVITFLLRNKHLLISWLHHYPQWFQSPGKWNLTLLPLFSYLPWSDGTTSSWLSWSLRPFLYSCSIYSCQLFLISSASIRSLMFLSFVMPIHAWNVPLIIPIFLKSSLVFPILLHCSLKKAFWSLLTILWNSGFSWVSNFPFCSNLLLLSFLQLFVKPPQTTTLPPCIFLRDGFGHCLLYNVMNLCP